MVHSGFFRFVCLSACFILKAAGERLVLEPSKLVVEYGAKASANCSTTYSHEGIGWEASEGRVDLVEKVQFLTWIVPKLTHWDIKPICYINSKDGQFDKNLPVTVYKIPDTLSINYQYCSGPVIEGKTCWLQCNIQNVAPVQYLKVMWYKQQSLMKNITFNETTINPVNKSVDLIIWPSRNDDGAKYWCETKLELGPEGPQPPPARKSDTFSIAVHYKPVFSNDTEITEVGDEKIILNCTTRTNPPSKYTWDAPHMENQVMLQTPIISVSRSGNYTCTASNQYGTAKKLFIVKPKYYNTTFWAILGVGLCVAALLIAGCIIKYRSKLCGRSAKTPSPAEQKEEGAELVPTSKSSK